MPEVVVEENKEAKPPVIEPVVPPVVAKTEVKAPEPPATKPDLSAKVKDDPDADPVPDADGFVKMPAKAFLTRVKRASKTALMDMFGTDDKDAILKWKRDYDGMVTKQEADRVAQLSKEEKLNEELKAANEKAAKIEQDFTSFKAKQEYKTADREVAKLASKHIDDEAVEFVAMKFSKYYSKLDPKDPEEKALIRSYLKHPEKIEEWCGEYAKKHPKYAREAAPEKKEKVVEAKPPITNGKPPENKPRIPITTPTGKTFKPGQPNSMTREEMKRQGISY